MEINTSTPREPKTYLYNFTSGGWNSVIAKTKRSAIRLAKKEWANNNTLIINEKSFRISTPADYRQLLLSFD